MTFLLYNNAYSAGAAADWEKDIFIRNVKSFNKALGNDYHTDLRGFKGDDAYYNQTLIDQV